MAEPVHLLTIDSEDPRPETKPLTLVSFSDSFSHEVFVATCSTIIEDIDMNHLKEYVSHKEKGRINVQSLIKHEVIALF